MTRIAELKSTLHHYIAETDDAELLSKVQQYVQELLAKEDKIVAYNAEGEPLNQAAYKQDIDNAIEEAEKGDAISQDEMEKDL